MLVAMLQICHLVSFSEKIFSKGIVISISAKSAKITENYQKILTCYFYFFKVEKFPCAKYVPM
jgi:hypothetical protein